MKREDVYKLIDGERDYQDTKWEEGRSLSDAETSIAAWIIYIEHHLSLAKASIYYLKETGALDEIRKITALGVACMEYNKTPARQVWEQEEPETRKLHWYPHRDTDGNDDYGVTACGLDGAQVGGLITGLFKQMSVKERCKNCNEKYNKAEKSGDLK